MLHSGHGKHAKRRCTLQGSQLLKALSGKKSEASPGQTLVNSWTNSSPGVVAKFTASCVGCRKWNDNENIIWNRIQLVPESNMLVIDTLHSDLGMFVQWDLGTCPKRLPKIKWSTVFRFNVDDVLAENQRCWMASVLYNLMTPQLQSSLIPWHSCCLSPCCPMFMSVDAGKDNEDAGPVCSGSSGSNCTSRQVEEQCWQKRQHSRCWQRSKRWVYPAKCNGLTEKALSATALSMEMLSIPSGPYQWAAGH